MPATPDTEQPKREADGAADDRGRGVSQTYHVADNHDRRAGESRCRVDLGLQHGGHASEQQVPAQSSSHGGQDAEEDRHQRRETVGEGLLGTGDGEDGQPGGVEHEDWLMQALNPTVPDQRGCPCREGQAWVAPVADPFGGVQRR